ncbi:MAG: hypothetical protein U0992_14520 [Planctomycetaceae bacterium]
MPTSRLSHTLPDPASRGPAHRRADDLPTEPWRAAAGIVRRPPISPPCAPLAIPLSDQHKHPAKLERYYGRALIVIVFFDKTKRADQDPYLTRLRDAVSTG